MDASRCEPWEIQNHRCRSVPFHPRPIPSQPDGKEGCKEKKKNHPFMQGNEIVPSYLDKRRSIPNPLQSRSFLCIWQCPGPWPRIGYACRTRGTRFGTNIPHPGQLRTIRGTNANTQRHARTHVAAPAPVVACFTSSACSWMTCRRYWQPTPIKIAQEIEQIHGNIPIASSKIDREEDAAMKRCPDCWNE